MRLIGVILSFNEEVHLSRCLSHWGQVLDAVYLVDSLSTDSTLQIAQQYNCKIFQREFDSYSDQFNWSLSQIDATEKDWIIKIDCDEISDQYLIRNLKSFLETLPYSTTGVTVNRSIYFQQKPIRHGGLFPQKNLRIFRYGYGLAENKMMDEHIQTTGNTIHFPGQIHDICLKDIDFWLYKHILYAKRKAQDINSNQTSLSPQSKLTLKSALEIYIYNKLPAFWLGPLIYFLYRYVVRLGFLDGANGFMYHFLHAFWYRLLINYYASQTKNI